MKTVELQLPEDLVSWLEERAEETERTLEDEVTYRLVWSDPPRFSP